MIDFRELAAALALRLELKEARQLVLTIRRVDGPEAVRPIPIRIRAQGALPSSLAVRLPDRKTVTVALQTHADGTATVSVPAGS